MVTDVLYYATVEATTHSLEEFRNQARGFAAGIRAAEDRATVITLSGDLGTGKTTYVQAVAAYFDIPEPVTSPTFVIEKVYECANGPFARLIHIDAYRLKGAYDLEILGWPELIAEPSNLILIEWPERVEGAVPRDAIRITLSDSGESRTITYE